MFIYIYNHIIGLNHTQATYAPSFYARRYKYIYLLMIKSSESSVKDEVEDD